MGYVRPRAQLYHPTVDDVVTALRQLNSDDDMSDHRYLFAWGVGEVGDKLQRSKALEPRYMDWKKAVSSTVLTRALNEAVAAERIVVLDGRKGAGPWDLTRGGMREHGSYYLTVEHFAAAKVAREAKELSQFKRDMAEAAAAEVLARHREELKALIGAGMDRYEAMASAAPEHTRSARAHVLGDVKHLFETVTRSG